MKVGKIIIVTSGKGGVGKSSVAAGLGAAMARRGKRVLLVDMDIALRSLDLILGVGNRAVFDWGDLLQLRVKDKQCLMPVEGYDGLYVLPAPVKLDFNFNVFEVRKLFKAISKEFDYLFMDSPAGIGRGFDMAALPAEQALIVATPDPICIRSAAKVSRILDVKNVTSQRLIINRFRATPVQKGRLPDIDSVIDGTAVRLVGIVPEDPNIVYSAAKGRPIPYAAPAAKAFDRIARRMENEEIPLKRLEKM